MRRTPTAYPVGRVTTRPAAADRDDAAARPRRPARWQVRRRGRQQVLRRRRRCRSRRGVEHVEKRDGAEREVGRHEDERPVLPRAGDARPPRAPQRPHRAAGGARGLGGRQTQRVVASTSRSASASAGARSRGRRVSPEDEQVAPADMSGRDGAAALPDEPCLAPGPPPRVRVGVVLREDLVHGPSMTSCPAAGRARGCRSRRSLSVCDTRKRVGRRRAGSPCAGSTSRGRPCPRPRAPRRRGRSARRGRRSRRSRGAPACPRRSGGTAGRGPRGPAARRSRRCSSKRSSIWSLDRPCSAGLEVEVVAAGQLAAEAAGQLDERGDPARDLRRCPRRAAARRRSP